MKQLEDILRVAANGTLRVLHPFSLIEVLPKCPDRSVLAGSVKANNSFIPSIYFICPEQDIDYFGIKVTPPEPNLKFRYLQFENLSIIEIILRFNKKRDLILHLNPANELVRHFLLSCTAVNTLSFQFHCIEKKKLVGAFTNLDNQEIDWLKRNYSRSLTENFKTDLFAMTSKQLSHEVKSNERHYRFNEITDKKILAENSFKFMEYDRSLYH